MSHRTAIMTAIAACMLCCSPLSMAGDQNHDMADRIYEKFKERDKSQRKEQRSRSTDSRQTQRTQRQRTDTRTSESSERQRRTTAKSREVTRESREFEQSQERSRSRNSDYRSSSAQERRSRDTGEQLSREIRNLLNRKSERSSSRDTVRQTRPQTQSQNSYMDERALRQTSEGGDRVSLDQAVNIVRRQSDGKVISARTEGSGSSRKHRIKVLIGERRVRTYVVSAATGQVY